MIAIACAFVAGGVVATVGILFVIPYGVEQIESGKWRWF